MSLLNAAELKDAAVKEMLAQIWAKDVATGADSEVETTDAGTYSTSSSDVEPPMPTDKALQHLRGRAVRAPPGLCLPEEAAAAAAAGAKREAKCGNGPWSVCSGAPLEPIPGSPCQAAWAAGSRPIIPPPPVEPAPPALKEAAAAELPAAALEHGGKPSILAYSPASPRSPKKRARAAMLARAKRERVPLKVREPQGCSPKSSACRAWDPSLPVKKAFVPRSPKSALAAKRLVPGVPAKKRESGFLLQDPPRTVTATAISPAPKAAVVPAPVPVVSRAPPAKAAPAATALAATTAAPAALAAATAAPVALAATTLAPAALAATAAAPAAVAAPTAPAVQASGRVAPR